MTIVRQRPAEWATEAAAIAAGLRQLADMAEAGEVEFHDHGIEILFNPGGAEKVRTEANRLKVKTEESPLRCRARLRLSPKVAYVLWAAKDGSRS